MSFKDFLELTPREFYESLWEREKHEEDVVLAQIRTICETVRVSTFHLLNAQMAKGRRIRDIKKLGVFSWERVDKPAQTLEEMKSVMKAIAKGFKPKKKKDAKKRNVRR